MADSTEPGNAFPFWQIVFRENSRTDSEDEGA